MNNEIKVNRKLNIVYDKDEIKTIEDYKDVMNNEDELINFSEFIRCVLSYQYFRDNDIFINFSKDDIVIIDSECIDFDVRRYIRIQGTVNEECLEYVEGSNDGDIYWDFSLITFRNIPILYNIQEGGFELFFTFKQFLN